MDFAYSPRVEALRQQLRAFMDQYIVPRIGAWHAEVAAGQYPVSFMDDLKALAPLAAEHGPTIDEVKVPLDGIPKGATSPAFFKA